MSAPPQDDGLISVFIDDTEVRCRPGANVIDVAASAGREIPHFCYHEKLSVAGNCRMCLVETGMPGRDRATGKPLTNADGSPFIQWAPGPAIACGTKAAPGMRIRTQSETVRKCREGVMEFLLINHPLDCPICDQAGECRLQEFATDYGRGASRYVDPKNVKPKRTRLGPRVTLDDERCILCSRCIRFCREIARDDVLGFVDRGSATTLTCHPGRRLENNYSLNTVDLCPVGALTSTDFRFKMRVWFLKTTPSICTESSVGVNTVVWSREGVIYRITPRRNDAVNDEWMADTGRLLYQQVEAENRLREPRLDGRPTTIDEAIGAAAILLTKPETRDRKPEDAKGGPGNAESAALDHRPCAVAIVASGRQSIEEQFLTRRLAAAVQAAGPWLVARVGEGDQLLISADRQPNVRGALVTGLIDDLPRPQLAELAAAIESGAVQTVLSCGEDLVAAGLSAEHLARVAIIYLGTHGNATSDAARVVLPARTVFEKDGSFVNQQFRLQKFQAAIPGAAGTTDDLELLAHLLEAAGGGPQPTGVEAVWTALPQELPELAALTWALIPPTGTVLASARWAGLPFPEGPSLHYAPAATPVAERV